MNLILFCVLVLCYVAENLCVDFYSKALLFVFCLKISFNCKLLLFIALSSYLILCFSVRAVFHFISLCLLHFSSLLALLFCSRFHSVLQLFALLPPLCFATICIFYIIFLENGWAIVCDWLAMRYACCSLFLQLYAVIFNTDNENNTLTNSRKRKGKIIASFMVLFMFYLSSFHCICLIFHAKKIQKKKQMNKMCWLPFLGLAHLHFFKWTKHK